MYAKKSGDKCHNNVGIVDIRKKSLCSSKILRGLRGGRDPTSPNGDRDGESTSHTEVIWVDLVEEGKEPLVHEGHESNAFCIAVPRRLIVVCRCKRDGFGRPRASLRKC